MESLPMGSSFAQPVGYNRWEIEARLWESTLFEESFLKHRLSLKE